MATQNALLSLVLAAITIAGCKSEKPDAKPVAVETASPAAPTPAVPTEDPELEFLASDAFENACERGFGSFCGNTSTDLWLKIHSAQPRVVAGNFMFIGFPENPVKQAADAESGDSAGKNTVLQQAGLVRLYERTEGDDAGVQFRGEYQLVGPKPFEHLGKRLAGTEGFVAVSAPLRNTCDKPDCAQSGAVYVLQRTGEDGAWRNTASLTPEDQLCYDQFGASMLATGKYLFVNAPNKATCATAADAPGQAGCVVTGAVYVFEQNHGEWKQTAVIKPSEPHIFDFGERMWVKDAGEVVINATRGHACPNWDEVGARSKPTGARIPQPMDCEKREPVSFVYERDESGAWSSAGTTDDQPKQLNILTPGEMAFRPKLKDDEEPGHCE